ncbi:hypothetical protein [Nafulsella turpanensis]|uniref:hypothetical protein n=1 Tax=Nafulsella turpanensis TaxID=1265690 RepID=UPI0003661101|nr:hypothetical protein [Nafulsella turpanensis]
METSLTMAPLLTHPAAQSMWKKPVHSARSSLYSQAFSTPRKHRPPFRSAPLHYKPHDPCLIANHFYLLVGFLLNNHSGERKEKSIKRHSA